MREILTLQFGQRSNYLGTHFWNIQESYFTYSESEESLVDHDIHFRPGIGADGSETFTPRTVIYDLKGGFGTLRKYNALYELEEGSAIPRGLWDGSIAVQQHTMIPQHEYQKSLDLGLPPPQLSSETVRYWSDFNRVFYHPKSIVQLNEYELGSQLMPFENWAVGEDLFKDLDKEHDLLDRDIRPFVEECDQLRAIQVFTGTDDSWGGFAARYVDRLKDEFGKQSIWVWGLEEGAKLPRQKRALATANSARSIHDISPHASVYVPILDPPQLLPRYLNAEQPSEWHFSALISSAVESVTLPTRLRPYGGLESWLPGEGGPHKIFNLQATVPFTRNSEFSSPFEHKNNALIAGDDEDSDVDERLIKGFDLDFTPPSAPSGRKVQVFSQVLVTRDHGEDTSDVLKHSGSHIDPDKRLPMKRHPMVQRFHTTLGLPILSSFPSDLFGQRALGSKVGVCVALSATTRVRDKLEELREVIARSIAVDEREALANGLGDISQTYQERWESDSDSDDD